jgi:hypothetical protein
MTPTQRDAGEQATRGLGAQRYNALEDRKDGIRTHPRVKLDSDYSGLWNGTA